MSRERALLRVVAAAALALAAHGCGDGGKPAAGKDEAKGTGTRPALTVTVTTPRQTTLPVTLSANGNLVAWQEASVGGEAAGLRIAEVRVNVGDRVQRGDVLATLAPEMARADVAQARANLVQAEASAAEAAGNAQRARNLQGSGAMSATEAAQLLTAEKTASARVLAARAALDVQEVRLSQTTVSAPDDGIISARAATVGAIVGPGMELFRLIRKGRLEWRAEVTSAELGRIAPGTPVTITAASGARLRGRVRIIGPTVDAQSRTALVYVDVGTPLGPESGSARAGMFAHGEFELGTVSALTVPQAAIVVREGFSYVFRVNPDNRVTQVKVQVGRIAGDLLEIVSGAPAGTRIVASGAGFLNDGDLVRIAADPPASASGK